jgi:prevent-host-death family protein
MTKLIDALAARTNFGKLMEQSSKRHVRFLVSRRGKPQVVILGVEDYLKNIIRQPKLLTDVQLSAKGAGLDSLSDEDITNEISAYRSFQKKIAKKTKKG